MSTTSLPFSAVSDDAPAANSSALVHSSWPSGGGGGGVNMSVPEGCVAVVFSQMEYLPWNNPDNIVSAATEALAKRVADTLLLFIFLIGGPGNVINMAVFYKQGLSDRVNLCLFALALADELYLLVCMFIHGEQLHRQFTSSERYGPVITFLVNNMLTGLVGFSFVSNFLSAVIATERCLCVLNPLKFQTLMRTRTMAAIIAVAYVVVVGLFFIVALRYHIACVYDPETGLRIRTALDGELYIAHRQLVNVLDAVVFGAGLPTAAMVVVTVATVVTAVKLRHIVTWRSETSSSFSAREVALTRMLVVVSVVFLLLLFPVALTRTVWLFFPEMRAGRRHHNFYLTSLWIIEVTSYLNSTFNILVYYSMGSRYRHTFWEIFGRKKGGQRLNRQ